MMPHGRSTLKPFGLLHSIHVINCVLHCTSRFYSIKPSFRHCFVFFGTICCFCDSPGRKAVCLKIVGKAVDATFLKIVIQVNQAELFITFLSAFKEEYRIILWCRSGEQLILSQVSLENTTFSTFFLTFLRSPR